MKKVTLGLQDTPLPKGYSDMVIPDIFRNTADSKPFLIMDETLARGEKIIVLHLILNEVGFKSDWGWHL